MYDFYDSEISTESGRQTIVFFLSKMLQKLATPIFIY